jgi:aminoglycoside phosphotransferase (APT) family kinase protein
LRSTFASSCRLSRYTLRPPDAVAASIIRQHTSAYVSIRQHTSACVSRPMPSLPPPLRLLLILCSYMDRYR